MNSQKSLTIWVKKTWTTEQKGKMDFWGFDSETVIKGGSGELFNSFWLVLAPFTSWARTNQQNYVTV